MGPTPASGLVMGTRRGDLDPGLVRFLMRSAGLTVDQFHDLINHESGLLGVSETSPDLRDLLSRQDVDVRAAEAVALFCYRAKTGLGAMAAALGGLDTLVFAGGIGENSPEVRRRICDGLGFLGITLDQRRNAAGAPLISADDGRVAVRVIRTDEESMIASAAAAMVPQTRATSTGARELLRKSDFCNCRRRLTPKEEATHGDDFQDGVPAQQGVQAGGRRCTNRARAGPPPQDGRLLAGRQLPVGRPDLPLRQPALARAAEARARQAAAAGPLGNHAGPELRLRPPEPGHQQNTI